MARGAVDGSGLAFLETCAVGQSGTLSMNNCRDHGKFLWREPIMTHHARFFFVDTLITSLQDQIGLLEYQNSEHFAGIVGKSSAGWVTKGLS